MKNNLIPPTHYKQLLVLLLLVGIVQIATSQQVTQLPFIEDFETATGNAEWRVNTGGAIASRLTNKWVVSGTEKFSGDSCLLISNNGSDATYSHVQNTAVAYREFLLPPGTYDLSVAWRVLGDKDKDCLYVCWAPSSSVSMIKSSVAGLSGPVKTYACQLGAKGEKYLSGSSVWKVSTASVSVPNTGSAAQVSYCLFLVWDNDGAGGGEPSACVDFVQLSKSSCGKPGNVSCSFSNTVLNVNWTGSASEYEVQYRKFGDNQMINCGKTPGNKMVIKDVQEGSYDVLVRSICASDTSVWVCRDNVFVYDPSLHCLDYLNLHAPGVECTYGTYADPYTNKEVVDNGPVKSSMHTMYTIQGETDPRTGGRLKTIPDGAIASIRLSNWTEGDSPSGSIAYTYTVKPDAQILLIRYAAVLQYAAHHPPEEQTRILIKVYDDKGQLISNCTEADFNAADVSLGNTRGWQTYDPASGSEDVDGLEDRTCPIKWLDWASPLGVNLSSQVGKQVKIVITLYACSADYHFAYTYFTLDCESGALEGYSCGEQSEYSVTAPDGFDYEWYHHSDVLRKNVLSTERVFSIPSTQADTFMCDIIYKENSGCRFTLDAYLVPKVPVAAFTPRHTPHDCTNMLTLENTSGVLNDGRLSSTEKCEYTEWLITDLNTGEETVLIDSISPELYFPEDGGKISVRLTVGISGNMCTATKEIGEFTVPPIGATDTTIVKRVCHLPYVFGGVEYKNPGVYSNRNDNSKNKSYAGCDSILTLDLRFDNRIDTTVYDTICEGETYEFVNGLKYTTSSPPEGYAGTIKSTLGCDSVITLHLYVVPRVKVEFGPLSEICADDDYFDVPYDLLQGDATTYSLRFGEKAITAGFEDVDSTEVADGHLRIALPDVTVRPDLYTVSVLYNTDSCGAFPFDLSFTVNYPVKGIMEQKWNDAVALLNSEHNYGNFEYASYQWYRNGEVIPGATNSYIYIGNEGGHFNLGDEYRVMLTRADDSVSIMSCPFVPTERTDKSEYISLRQPQGVRALYVEPIPDEEGVAQWYTHSGLYLGECLISMSDGLIATPATTGIYVLRLIFPSETYNFKVMIE